MWAVTLTLFLGYRSDFSEMGWDGSAHFGRVFEIEPRTKNASCDWNKKRPKDVILCAHGKMLSRINGRPLNSSIRIRDWSCRQDQRHLQKHAANRILFGTWSPCLGPIGGASFPPMRTNQVNGIVQQSSPTNAFPRFLRYAVSNVSFALAGTFYAYFALCTVHPTRVRHVGRLKIQPPTIRRLELMQAAYAYAWPPCQQMGNR